jgi:hypothetical protein
MKIPNFGATIFPIAYTKWYSGQNTGKQWFSNIYSEDEYWRGERWLDVESPSTSGGTKTSHSAIYEEIKWDATTESFEAKFESNEFSGFRIFKIEDKGIFSISSYDQGKGLIGKEMFFAMQEPMSKEPTWKSMLTTCHHWESTITNDKFSIVGYRKINIFDKLCFFQINAPNGRRLATEYFRNASRTDMGEVGGKNQFIKLCVARDQAHLNGELNVPISKAGILLNSDKPIAYHLELAKKAGIKSGYK